MDSLRHGDCLAEMAAMDAGSVDAVVTDPPYGLEFMGKEWDKLVPEKPKMTATEASDHMVDGSYGPWGRRKRPVMPNTYGHRNEKCLTCGKWRVSSNPCKCDDPQWESRLRKGTPHSMAAMQRWHEAWATEALRVLKPSHYLLAFGGTRTWHRLACAIEDAGFEIRDTLMWLYGSGFPKGKSCLKPAWEPIILARKPGPMRELGIDSCRISAQPGDYDHKPFVGPGNNGGLYGNYDHNEMPPPHPSGRWPANLVLECTCDETREGTAKTPATYTRGADSGNQNAYAPGIGEPAGTVSRNYGGPNGKEPVRIHTDPNCPCAMLDGQTGTWRTAPSGRPSAGKPQSSLVGASGISVHAPATNYGDSGGASRFFYCAKASRSERNAGCEGMDAEPAGVLGIRSTDAGAYVDFLHPSPDGIGSWLQLQRESAGLTAKAAAAHFPSASGGVTGCIWNWEHEANRPTPEQWAKLRRVIGFDGRYDAEMTETKPIDRAVFDGRDRTKAQNHHPTVKPLALCRWLVKLVAQPGDVVLDPFMGSGTTGVACAMEGRDFIGIEQSSDYIEIARRRIAHASAQERLPV